MPVFFLIGLRNFFLVCQMIVKTLIYPFGRRYRLSQPTFKQVSLKLQIFVSLVNLTFSNFEDDFSLLSQVILAGQTSSAAITGRVARFVTNQNTPPTRYIKPSHSIQCLVWVLACFPQP